jgi:hypothetical protein
LRAKAEQAFRKKSLNEAGIFRTRFRDGATDRQGARLPQPARNERRTFEENNMLRKLTIALAAALSLSALALAPSTAFAKGGMGGMGGGWGFHHHHFGGFGLAVGYADDGCYVTQRVLTPYGYRLRTVNVCAY